MDITCIADLHGHKPKLPGGDLLILAGDYTSKDTIPEWADFFYWLKQQSYRKKILVAGNHDSFLQTAYPTCATESEKLKEVQEFLDDGGELEEEEFEYLCDSGTDFEGIVIWGSPWTKSFKRMNPFCRAFTVETEEELDYRFSLIPDETEILVTHGPPRHMLDINVDGYACGSSSLRKHVDRVKPRLHVFGHIHEQGNNELRYHRTDTWCVNCSYVNGRYQPINEPIRIEL